MAETLSWLPDCFRRRDVPLVVELHPRLQQEALRQRKVSLPAVHDDGVPPRVRPRRARLLFQQVSMAVPWRPRCWVEVPLLDSKVLEGHRQGNLAARDSLWLEAWLGEHRVGSGAVRCGACVRQRSAIACADLVLFLLSSPWPPQVSTDYHVLFASTSLVWVAVIGYAFLGEQPTTEVWCLTLFMTVGNIMLSLQFTSEKQATVLGLVTNLLVPVLQGVCIVLMRHASLVLFPQWMTKESSNSGRLSGGANSLRGFETRDFYFNLDTLVGYTSVKCFFSFLAALAAALAKEGYFADVPFWDALSIGIALDLVVGSVVTFFLQGSLVLLSMLSVALTTGVLSVLKVIPQTFAAIWFSSSVFDPTALHIAGVSIIILSSLAYAWLRLKH
mmetsp:Transcript_2598/g.7151  ORF Transcript_2598/g.7151 Transcript_2598/m.7151 type:complete len:387 (-) Transcript_2598:157-1317(-)